MKCYTLLLTVFAIQLHAETFDEFRKSYINDHRCCIVEAIEIANKNNAFPAPLPDLEKSAQELNTKGLERYLEENHECSYYPQEARCTFHTHLMIFLDMSKEKALAYTQQNIQHAQEAVAWEKQWLNNNHDPETVKEAQNRKDALKKVISLMKAFHEQAQAIE